METKQLTQAGTNRTSEGLPMTTGSRVPLGKAPALSSFFECGPLGFSETRSQGLGEVLLDSPAGISSTLIPLRNPESSR